MTAQTPPRVRSAELLQDGVAITFSDGKAALFSAELLYASLPQAHDLAVDDEDDGADH